VGTIPAGAVVSPFVQLLLLVVVLTAIFVVEGSFHGGDAS